MRFKKVTSNQNFKMYLNNYIENYSRKYSERNYIINYNLPLIFKNKSFINKTYIMRLFHHYFWTSKHHNLPNYCPHTLKANKGFLLTSRHICFLFFLWYTGRDLSQILHLFGGVVSFLRSKTSKKSLFLFFFQILQICSILSVFISWAYSLSNSKVMVETLVHIYIYWHKSTLSSQRCMAMKTRVCWGRAITEFDGFMSRNAKPLKSCPTWRIIQEECL